MAFRFIPQQVSSRRFATTSIRLFNPHTSSTPTNPKFSHRIGIFVLRPSSIFNGASLLVPRSTFKDSIRSPSQSNSPIQAKLLDGYIDTSDATIWDSIQRVTHKETGLRLEGLVGQFDFSRHVEIEDDKGVKQAIMNFVVAVKRGEMNVSMHPGDNMQWMWIQKHQIAGLEMKQSSKQGLEDAFACAERSKEHLP